jgi:predicted TIM-barrel fold metal-dependent hydrolase
MSQDTKLNIIDFHNHYVSRDFEVTATRRASAHQREHWRQIGSKISDIKAILAKIEAGDINARVINTPPALIGDEQGAIPEDAPRRINDGLAEIVARNSHSVHALATVDAYRGEAAGKEVERAIKTLGLRGVFVESAKGDLLLDAPEARPALAAAAELGVPVFVHPINPKGLSDQLAPYGRIGTSQARGAVNSAALVSLLGGGVFDELPNLRVVVTTLAIGAILTIGALGGADIGKDAPAGRRRHVYIDTMGVNPTLIRATVDLLGADHVLYGTDWPLYDDDGLRDRLTNALVKAGLNADEQRLVAGGNSARLLGLKI